MQSEIDKRGKLNDEPFDFEAKNDGRLCLFWNGKLVRTLKGTEAQKLLAKVSDAPAQDIQLALAKATGNFKRGNERRQP